MDCFRRSSHRTPGRCLTHKEAAELQPTGHRKANTSVVRRRKGEEKDREVPQVNSQENTALVAGQLELRANRKVVG